jgi:2-hydroxy-3-oxopropionate reductase
MGRAMVRNLAKLGAPVVAFDRHPERVAAVTGEGITGADSIAQVSRASDVVITMLPDGPNVLEAVTGDHGVLSALRAGGVVVDMSSINPLVAQQIGRACSEKGVSFLDAPVSGGEPKAIEGTLAVMAGGEQSVFDQVLPLLQSMASSVLLTGPVGSGNVTKLANQIMVACNIAAMSEAFVLAERCGVPPDVVFNAVKGGLAGSTVLNAKAPMVIARDFKPGFRIRLHQKDLRNATATAESVKVALPLTNLVHQLMIASMNGGDGELDHAGLFRLIESLSSQRNNE